MLGDEAQPAESARRERTRSGPRHAAPRKSLLTKLHMPAGKAVALAAMPTAVLMGMGLTPHLAQADEPKSPFKPGPCVTQSETPTPSPSGTAKKDSAGSAKKDDKATPKPTTSPSATTGKNDSAPEPETSPSADAAKPDTAASAPATQPTASPSPTKSVNPLDPLGLGDLLGGLLGIGDATQPTASPTPTPTQPSATPTATPKTTQDAKDAEDPVKDTVKGVVTTADGALQKTKDTVKDTVKGATDGASKTAKSLTGDDSAATAGDPQSFPCPTYDAKALADAQTEQGIPLLPDDPWVLKSSLLTLYGLKYDGIVQVKTYGGTVKDVLKFTATGIDIGDLHQIVDGPGGTKTHVTAAKGSTSTFRNGTVTMYTESLSGNLLGVVPITFTPKAPPPLTLPVLFFTDVTVIQAGQFGGTLTVPGMKVLPGQDA
ncbi:hydrogenase expression protein HypF [Streptomyces sp. NPDC021020]|uniref:hydrogenase expression protein HypF n=1 Tax=Streptomyces sp. NPDC021020 TaxID=3365109 RepID=UPI00378F934E